MDKLGIVGSALVPHPDKRSGKKVEKEKTKGISFKSKLRESAQEEPEIGTERLSDGLTGMENPEELLDDVYRAGEALKEDAALSSLKRYRNSVKRFYRFVVSRSLEADQVNGRLNPRTMSRKQYTLISIIDEKLERLGACVLKNQKDQLEILRKVDEIYGILIDLKR
jgi:uncharacterized protein